MEEEESSVPSIAISAISEQAKERLVSRSGDSCSKQKNYICPFAESEHRYSVTHQRQSIKHPKPLHFFLPSSCIGKDSAMLKFIPYDPSFVHTQFMTPFRVPFTPSTHPFQYILCLSCWTLCYRLSYAYSSTTAEAETRGRDTASYSAMSHAHPAAASAAASAPQPAQKAA